MVHLDATTAEPTDAVLLRRSADGDQRAFAELVDRHGGSLRRYLAGLVPAAAVDDLVQQTFLSAYRAADSFRGESQVRTWLFRIAKNAAWHHRKKEARYQPMDEPDEEALLELGVAAGWGCADPERLAQRAHRRELLTAALESLHPRDREVILLRDVEDLSGEDVAELLELSLAAMKSRLHRARLRLAAALRSMELEDEVSHA